MLRFYVSNSDHCSNYFRYYIQFLNSPMNYLYCFAKSLKQLTCLFIYNLQKLFYFLKTVSSHVYLVYYHEKSEIKGLLPSFFCLKGTPFQQNADFVQIKEYFFLLSCFSSMFFQCPKLFIILISAYCIRYLSSVFLLSFSLFGWHSWKPFKLFLL